MANQAIVVSCKRANLKRIRQFVADALTPFALADVLQNQLILAVDEVCANFIIHSSNEDETKKIKVAISNKANQLIFEISDDGKAYNPGTYREPKLQDLIQQRRKGGVGIMLVNRIMDNVEYEVIDGRNICRLYKTL